ncbi:MAG: PaaI family thioesterase [Rhodoblastus sp.]|nr:MAG: PaaI family thioesterase [Rhodoblastus sp.]
MSKLKTLGPGKSGLDLLRLMQQADNRAAMAVTLDMHIVAVEEGRVTLESTPGRHLENTNGVVQGGYAASLLDMACGYAIISRLPAGKTCATLELKVAYHRAVRFEAGAVKAEGKVTSLGRAAFSEARLTDAAGALLSSATATFLITEL